MSLSARVGEIARFLAIGALAALSLPGVRAARAEADLLPPISQLFAWNSPSHASAAQAGPVSCAAQSDAVQQAVDARRRAARAQIAQRLMAGPGGGEVLNGRGYGYPVQRDPYQELRGIELEAQRQRALRAAGAH